MEKKLINEIIKYSPFDCTIIDKLTEHQEKEIREKLSDVLLSHFEPNNIERMELMINSCIEVYNEQIYTINYIQNINIIIKPYFYEKIKEPFYDDSIELTEEEWAEIWEVEEEYLPFNEYTLAYATEFQYTDMIDEYFTHGIYDSHDIIKSYIPPNELQKLKDERIKDYEEYKKIRYRDWKTYQENLTEREEKLVLFSFEMTIIKGIRQGQSTIIKEKYNIKNNTPEKNQEILNNSYDVVIEHMNINDMDDIIINDKINNDKLFTNAKRRVQFMKKHYMDFLLKCNTAYLVDYDKFVFKEFVEAYIRGYKQYKELISISEAEKNKILKEYKEDLKVLKKYNKFNENAKNIEELKKEIQFLENPNKHYEMIIFKELSNQFKINTPQIAKYLIHTKGTTKRTVLNNFDKISTKPTDIKINIL